MMGRGGPHFGGPGMPPPPPPRFGRRGGCGCLGCGCLTMILPAIAAAVCVIAFLI